MGGVARCQAFLSPAGAGATMQSLPGGGPGMRPNAVPESGRPGQFAGLDAAPLDHGLR